VSALGLAIQVRRKELDLSQEELAQKAGLHRTYISEIERRSRNLSVKILVKLALALDTTPATLVVKAEEMAKQRNAELVAEATDV
jgi:transcriptional regulator with XRE-family HTH domain